MKFKIKMKIFLGKVYIMDCVQFVLLRQSRDNKWMLGRTADVWTTAGVTRGDSRDLKDDGLCFSCLSSNKKGNSLINYLISFFSRAFGIQQYVLASNILPTIKDIKAIKMIYHNNFYLVYIPLLASHPPNN